jgi:hypothetical protein
LYVCRYDSPLIILAPVFQDYNYIESLGERVFTPVSPRKLYLGHNRISEMHNNTFQGLEDILELVSNSSKRFETWGGLNIICIGKQKIKMSQAK